jgi:hypothetical protein
MGYKLEVPPIFPGIGAGVLNVYGDDLRKEMAALPHTNAVLALLRDGFVEQSPAAACAWPTTAARCSTTSSATMSGKACARLPEHG